MKTVIVIPRASPKAMCNHDPVGSIVDLSPFLFCEAPNGWRYLLVGGTRLAVETVKTQSQEIAKKRGAYPPVHCTHC